MSSKENRFPELYFPPPSKIKYFCFYFIILQLSLCCCFLVTLQMVRCQYPGARDVSSGVMWSSADARRSWCWQPRFSIRPWHQAAPVIKTDTKPIIHTGDKHRHNNTEWCHNHGIIKLTKVPYGPIHSFSLHTNNAVSSGNFTKIDVSPSKNIDVSQFCDPHCHFQCLLGAALTFYRFQL